MFLLKSILCLTCLLCLNLFGARWFESPPGEAAATSLQEGRSFLADLCLQRSADYYHSGALPSIFAFGQSTEMQEGHDHHDHSVFDQFLRNFYPTGHTHLDSGGASGKKDNLVAEVLPWLWLAAALDPKRDYPYSEAAFWLRKSLGMPRVAESFLREGYRQNPDSILICYELGKIAWQDHDNIPQARFYLARSFNLFEAHPTLRSENQRTYAQLLGVLAQIEQDDRNYEQAVVYLNRLQNYSPFPEAIRQWSQTMQTGASH